MTKLKSNFKSTARRTLFAVLTVLAPTLAAEAQTVTISPQTGNVIAATSTEGESHMAGYGGAWIHNQLPMDWFNADNGTLNGVGVLSTHANNIKPDGSGFIAVSGDYNEGAINHMTLSLPKGYRFTGYNMVISYSSANDGSADCTMREMDSSFKTTYASVKVTKSSKNVSLSRSSSLTDANPMGNILYFLQDINSGISYVKIESFEVSFECDMPFEVNVRPTTASTSGVDCAAFSYGTERIDLGAISWSRGNNGYNYAWRYNYNNVKALNANFMLYDDDGISNGSASTSAKDKGNIKATSVGGSGMYYALQNDVYYLETPTDGITQDNINIPVGYRIVDARLHYASQTKAPSLGSSFYITDGNGKYMNASLKFTTTPVLWESDNSGYVWTGSTYLKKNSTGYLNNPSLGTASNKEGASTFKINGTGLYCQSSTILGGSTNYYVSTSGSLSGDHAVLVSNEREDGDCTIDLYGTDANKVVATATVNTENPSGTLEVTGLNNDAVKFEVKDVKGTAAYVYVELVLEALNPYISRMDVAARTKDKAETLSQSYLSTDFTIGDNGEVSLNVPDNFASDGVQVLFDNLANKKADETYGPLANDGHSRYHFVKSKYYDLINENLQERRADAANHDYADKIRVEVAGDKQFTVNNSDEFKVGTAQSSQTNYYKENRYTNAEYQTQGGTWNEVNLSKDNKEATCYLVTCDETRYNIAPTTTPRHAFYAYYNTHITLNVADYEPSITYTKVYDNAMLASGFDNNAYYGAKIGAKMQDTGEAVESGKGYLFAKQIVSQINADAGKTDCPKDAKHVLYVDASDLNSVLSSAEKEETYGKIELIQDAIGDNAMIYLPAGLTYTLRNVASKTVSGDFRAENNIILVDKQPFFAPYDIRVDANNYTQYTREVTSTYGKSKYISLVLPFNVDIYADGDKASGVHINKQGGSAFQFHQMQLTDAISDVEKKDNYDYEVTGHFTPATGMKTESNKPYLVEVISTETGGDENTNIVVRQNGASIAKTPTDAKGLGTLLEGETATGKIGNNSVTFINHGSLNGVKLDGNEGTYFYFAKDRFVSSDNLLGNNKDVYVMPFRAYFDYEGTSHAKYMNISLDPYSGDATGIDEINGFDGDFKFCSANGTLTITAARAMTASIRAINGQTITKLTMQAGDTRQVNVPSGVYLVNGVKVLVK